MIKKIIPLMIIISVILAIFHVFTSKDEENVLIHINEMSIKSDELKLIESCYEFDLVQSGGDIGSREYIDALVDKTIKIKSELILMKEQGLIEDVSYEGLKVKYEKDKKDRKEAVEKGKLVHGLVEFDFTTYFKYLFSSNRSKLISIYTEDKSLFEKQDVQIFYEENKDRMFKEEDDIRVVKIYVPYFKEERGQYVVYEELKKEALEKIEKIYEDISQGGDFKKYDYSQEEFNDETKHMDKRFMSQTYQTALNMSKGDISGIIDNGYGFFIIECLDRSRGDYVFIDKVRPSIETILTNLEYPNYLEKRIQEFEIFIEQKKIYQLYGE